MAVYPDQAFFSKKPVRKPDDFKGLEDPRAQRRAGLAGRRARGRAPHHRLCRDLHGPGARHAGRGDHGTKPGFGLRWYEVSKYLVGPISMRPHVALAINKNAWKRLPPDIQKIMKEEAETLVEGKAFEAIEAWNKEGIDKNVEKGMEHQPVLAGDCMPAIKDVLRTKVVPDWVKRAGGAEAARLFNEIIAPLVGFTAGS